MDALGPWLIVGCFAVVGALAALVLWLLNKIARLQESLATYREELARSTAPDLMAVADAVQNRDVGPIPIDAVGNRNVMWITNDDLRNHQPFGIADYSHRYRKEH